MRSNLHQLTIPLLTTFVVLRVTLATVKQTATILSIGVLSTIIFSNGAASAQTLLRPLMGDSLDAIHSQSPLLVLAQPKTDSRLVVILSKRNELQVFEETDLAFEFRSSVSLDTSHCHTMKLVKKTPATLLAICQNSLRLVDLESLKVQSLGIDGFVLEAAVDKTLGRILALTSQGGGYNFGSKISWLSQDPSTAQTRVLEIDTQSLESKNFEVLHESCYNGKLALDSLRGPLAFCVNASKRSSRPHKAVTDTTVTLLSKHFKITKRFMGKGPSLPHFIVGHTSHQRIPSMLGFNATGLLLHVDIIDLAPIDPPRLNLRRTKLELRSPLSTSSGKPQIILRDIDDDMLDELILAENDGVEIFKFQRGRAQQIGYLHLSKDSLSNHSFSDAQFSLNKAQGSIELLYLASAESGWHIASSRLR
jgi:hypothetical protein